MPVELSRLNPLEVWRRWTALTTDGELARRREAVLLNVLAAMVVLATIVQTMQTVMLLIVDTSVAYRGGVWVATFAFLVALHKLLQTARRGRQRVASVGLLLVLSATLAYLVILTGITNPVTVAIVILQVMLAAMLLGQPAMFGVLGAALVTISLSVIFDNSGIYRPPYAPNHEHRLGPIDTSGLVLVFGAIGAIVRLYTREYLVSIDEALTHGAENSPLRQMRTKTLSMREVEVVQLVAEGLSNDQIAARLFLSPRTVQSHVANSMKKTGSANRTELGALALREGLVPLHGEGVGLVGESQTAAGGGEPLPRRISSDPA